MRQFNYCGRGRDVRGVRGFLFSRCGGCLPIRSRKQFDVGGHLIPELATAFVLLLFFHDGHRLQSSAPVAASPTGIGSLGEVQVDADYGTDSEHDNQPFEEFCVNQHEWFLCISPAGRKQARDGINQLAPKKILSSGTRFSPKLAIFVCYCTTSPLSLSACSRNRS
jgi:hypothetical protein